MAWVREKNPKPKQRAPTRDPAETIYDVLRYFSGVPNPSKTPKFEQLYYDPHNSPPRKKRIPVIEVEEEEEDDDGDYEESKYSKPPKSHHRERRHSHHASEHEREASIHRYQPAGGQLSRPRHQPSITNYRNYTAPVRHHATSAGRRNVSTAWASAATPLAL